ncbi:MAG: AmmeMemoRadiSam system protein B, partial [Methanocorpusculum sp.]|nr:AmmeMemoRadiSam system protein B [Methanocorpusculum sp.]
ETNPRGILVPHAGLIYSGQTAACSYAKISPAAETTFVIIGTSHAGYETSVSTLIWDTPLGAVLPDTEFIEALPLQVDNAASRAQENSIEVQMPFIRYRFPQTKAVPILIGDQSPEGAARVAQAVLAAVKKTGRTITVIASGDGSHYVPREKAERDDLTVLAAVKNLDTAAFYAALRRLRPSMCGYGCIAAMAEIAAGLGAREARVLLYTTSGDVTGDDSSVVGYASMEAV